MEEEELLRALILALILFNVIPKAYASLEKDNHFANSYAKDARQLVIENAKQELLNFERDNESSGVLNLNDLTYELQTQKPKLLVFVSTSMPETLIKSYYNEAAKFGAVLVFKGLPNGSFREHAELILKLQGDQPQIKDNALLSSNKLAGSIIDDESFRKYAVERVPTIALIQEEECFDHASCKTTYDIISGNIGIKGALEEFAKAGELSNEAFKLLNIKGAR